MDISTDKNVKQTYNSHVIVCELFVGSITVPLIVIPRFIKSISTMPLLVVMIFEAEYACFTFGDECHHCITYYIDLTFV